MPAGERCPDCDQPDEPTAMAIELEKLEPDALSEKKLQSAYWLGLLFAVWFGAIFWVVWVNQHRIR